MTATTAGPLRTNDGLGPGLLESFGPRSWARPESTGLGRLASRTPYYSYDSANDARRETAEATPTPWWVSLDGTWRFAMFDRPEALTAGALDASPLPSSSITVPGTWQTQGWGRPHYLNVVYPFATEPVQPPDANPTGLYQRSFEISDDWLPRRTILRLGGTDSVHYVFVNGHPVGMGKDTRLTSDYDITEHVHIGTNELAIVVVQWSDASWLEDQDQWWLSGITRPVELLSVPPTHLLDVRAIGGLTEDGTTGLLELEAHIRFAAGDPERGWKVRAQIESLNGRILSVLIDAEDARPPARTETRQFDSRSVTRRIEQPVPTFDRRSPLREGRSADQFPGHRVQWNLSIPDIEAWWSDRPTLYRVVIELLDPRGSVVEVVAQRVGFRRIEIKNRELLINGRAVLIKGVNRHDHDAATGCVVSRETMRLDLVTMKRHNVNAVRTSHYPSDPYLYALCDELGLYVIAEANLETHGRYRQLIHEPSVQLACLDRMVRMVRRDKNHPSIIGWSLGNESGYGPIHDAMAAWTRSFDHSRFLHYEGPHRYGVGPQSDGQGVAATDVVCPMYPTIDAIVAWAERGRDRRPLILCEFSHAMGNSNGSLSDYWHAIRTHTGLQGGFIWEWIDHGLDAYDADGRHYWAYGGHFGDEPNDGAFIGDGLVWPDRRPHPGLLEAAHLWRPIRITSANAATTKVRVTNEREFDGLADIDCTWTLLADGIAVEQGSLELPNLAAAHSGVVSIRFERHRLRGAAEGHLVFECRLRYAASWTPAGHLLALDQLPIAPPAARRPASVPLHLTNAPAGLGSNTADNDVEVEIDATTGTVAQLVVAGQAILTSPIGFTMVRSFIDNDGVPDGQLGIPGIRSTWTAWGLQDAEVTTVSVRDSRRTGVRSVTAEELIRPSGSQAHLTVRRTITFERDNALRFQYEVNVPKELGDLPRLGTRFALAPGFDALRWFGPGPHESYVDRCSSGTIAVHESAVSHQYVPYLRPQDHGHHVDTRWFSLGQPDGVLLRVESAGETRFSFGARHHSDEALETATTTAELVASPLTFVHIDHLLRGVGTGSCGPDTLPRYRVGAGRHRWSWVLSLRQPLG